MLRIMSWLLASKVIIYKLWSNQGCSVCWTDLKSTSFVSGNLPECNTVTLAFTFGRPGVCLGRDTVSVKHSAVICRNNHVCLCIFPQGSSSQGARATSLRTAQPLRNLQWFQALIFSAAHPQMLDEKTS